MGYANGTIHQERSLSEQDAAYYIRLPGTFTFATLPPINTVGVGCSAWTSDQGNVHSNGTAWVAGTSSLVFAFASLPASPSAGQRAFVNNNSAAPAFLSAANASGSTTVPVFYNGSAWLVG